MFGAIRRGMFGIGNKCHHQLRKQDPLYRWSRPCRILLQLRFFDKQTWQVLIIVGIVIGLFFALIVLAVFARYFRLWIQSVTTGAGIGIFDLLGMTFRKVNPTVIVRSKIMAVQAGIGREQGVTSKALEAHYLAGGNVPLVIRSLIGAAKAKLVELDFKLATAIDLAGRNVLEAVQTSVNPKVIDCPGRGARQGFARRRGAERHSTEGSGESHGPREPAAVDRRGHRRDDHRPRGRRHRQRDRLVAIAS